MNLFIIADILGNLAYSVAAVLSLPLVYAALQGEADAAMAFFFAVMVSLVVGGALKQRGEMVTEDEIAVREGVAITGVGWFMVSLLSLLPYLLGGFLSPLDSLAESISGLSGTGATFIPDLDVLPRSLLLWRSLTHWIGGMGIIVLSLAILPFLGVGGMELYKAEVPGPTPEKITPRVQQTALYLWGVYVLLTALETAFLTAGGMGFFDALNHSFSTIATGGFSTKNASVGHFHSAYVEWVITAFMFASGEVIGVKPADAYEFRLFGTPVGAYFKGGVKSVRLCVSAFDRAAPHGTGHIKAGLNYAMSLHAYMTAHAAGFDENMFLDAATRTYIEETGGANFLFVTGDGTIVTPKSDSILPSITRRSLVHIAEHILGMKVEHRPVPFEELASFSECGLCGTAAVISPVGSVTHDDRTIVFPDSSDHMGPVLQKLYDTLRGIQLGTVPAPEGWIRKIC